MELEAILGRIARDFPILVAVIWVAKEYMRKHEEIVRQLIAAFQEEIQYYRNSTDRLTNILLEIERGRHDKS